MHFSFGLVDKIINLAKVAFTDVPFLIMCHEVVVNISAPSSVIRIVCSAWAVRVLSSVNNVKSSSNNLIRLKYILKYGVESDYYPVD